jgi:hypothetical protein
LNLLIDGFFVATLTAIFAALKLDGFISWPWWVVATPLWIGLILRFIFRMIMRRINIRFVPKNLGRDLPLSVWRDVYSLLHERGQTLRDLKAAISEQTDPTGTPREGSNWREALKEDSRLASRFPVDDNYKQSMKLGREGADRYRNTLEKLSK